MRRRSRKNSGAVFRLFPLRSCPAVTPCPASTSPRRMNRRNLIVPASWHGSSPFVEARPSDAEIRTDWWRLFREPVLDRLEMQAMAANPDLQAAAERFVQARDIMMKAQSRLFPRLGLGFGGSDNKQSENALFRAPDSPIHDVSVSMSESPPGSRIFGMPFATKLAPRPIAPSGAPLNLRWRV